MTEDLTHVMRARREKLDTLREMGVEPFAYSYPATDRSSTAVRAFEAAEVGEAVAAAERTSGE